LTDQLGIRSALIGLCVALFCCGSLVSEQPKF
jgi:hypothetical protein